MSEIIRLPNLLSLSRIFLALFFLSTNVYLRLFAVGIAALTDFLDGYLARRLNIQSKLGTLLDPISDKCFALFTFTVLYLENSLGLTQIACLLSRDIALILFTLYLKVSGKWTNYTIRSFWSGKIATTLQFAVLLLIICQIPVPGVLYYALITLGVSSLIELKLTS